MCVVHSTSLREAQMVRLSNARSELIGTRLRATQASKRCSPTRRNVWLTEPDTMDMVSTDEGDGIRGDPPRGAPLEWGGAVVGGPVVGEGS